MNKTQTEYFGADSKGWTWKEKRTYRGVDDQCPNVELRRRDGLLVQINNERLPYGNYGPMSVSITYMGGDVYNEGLPFFVHRNRRIKLTDILDKKVPLEEK
jgi:hypothetical protein